MDTISHIAIVYRSNAITITESYHDVLLGRRLRADKKKKFIITPNLKKKKKKIDVGQGFATIFEKICCWEKSVVNQRDTRNRKNNSADRNYRGRFEFYWGICAEMNVYEINNSPDGTRLILILETLPREKKYYTIIIEIGLRRKVR